MINGGNIHKIKEFSFRRSNELSNKDIDKLMSYYKIKTYMGCFIKDELPKELSDGFYIINLNGSSHWVALCKNGHQYIYFDSFGFLAPSDVEEKIPSNYIYSNIDIQDYDSSSCGYFCIAFTRVLDRCNNKMKIFDDFIKVGNFNPNK